MPTLTYNSRETNELLSLSKNCLWMKWTNQWQIKRKINEWQKTIIGNLDDIDFILLTSTFEQFF